MPTDTPTSHIEGWNNNYIAGRANRYPYDSVVSFVLRNFGGAPPEERKRIRILDLGCGGGNHVKFASDEGFDAYGVDGSPEAVRLTRELLGESESAKVVVAYFHDMPFASNYFDCVIDRQSIGHNRAEDIPDIVLEIRRILQPGGLYFGHVFGSETTAFRYGEPLGKGDYQDFKDGNFKRSHFVHAFDEEQITKLFSDFKMSSLRKISVENVITKDETNVVYEICAQKLD